MPNARNLSILTTALILTACDDPASPFIGDDDTGSIVVDFFSDPERWPLDPYVIDAATIAGDTLVLRIDYGGGCRTHAFALIAWNGWLESHPVQAGVVLAHEDRDDPCDAVVRSHLRFDLTPLRTAWVEAYRWPHGEIVILFSNPTAPRGPTLRTVHYEF